MRFGNQGTQKTFPVHELLKFMHPELIKNLPALHTFSASGCDTNSKVGSKLACLKKSLDLELLKDFGLKSLNDDMKRYSYNVWLKSVMQI